jgi:DNA-binding transcriptional LysR family regulator
MTTLRALECLVALVDHGSMSAAAGSLYMSQPAVSHQIAALEKEVGVPVVERLSRGVRVTVAGRAAAEEARIALRAAENAIQIGKRIGHSGAGRLRISCVETMTTWLLVPVLRQWRSRRPDVTLDLSEFTSADAMVEVLAAGGTDVAVGPRPTQTESHIEVFGQEDMVVVAAAGHRFAELTAVPVQALANEMFVHYDPSNGMAVWVDQLAAQHQVVLNPVLRTRSPRTAAHLAAAGMGVTVVPVSALPPRPTGLVRRLRPIVRRDIIAIVAAPSDTLVRSFIADLHRHGLPKLAWPKYPAVRPPRRSKCSSP